MADFDFTSGIERFLTVRSEGELFEELQRASHDLGFRKFALGHHVDLVGPPEDAIRLCNYDQHWIDHALGEGLYINDPVHHASTRTAAGFLWSDIPGLIRPTPKQARTLEIARTYGLGAGYTVPVHVPGEYRGTCSFAASSLERLTDNALPIANMLGIWAFEAGRRVMRLRRLAPTGLTVVPVLTDRQREALVLVAKGKADPEIGALLGISVATAHEHVENVRRAYGNAQRPYLVARALFDGQISYGEVFRR